MDDSSCKLASVAEGRSICEGCVRYALHRLFGTCECMQYVYVRAFVDIVCVRSQTINHWLTHTGGLVAQRYTPQMAGTMINIYWKVA